MSGVKACLHEGTYGVQQTVLLARLPKYDGTLPDVVVVRVSLTTTGEHLDLLELNPDPLGFGALWSDTNLEGLEGEGRGVTKPKRAGEVENESSRSETRTTRRRKTYTLDSGLRTIAGTRRDTRISCRRRQPPPPEPTSSATTKQRTEVRPTYRPRNRRLAGVEAHWGSGTVIRVSWPTREGVHPDGSHRWTVCRTTVMLASVGAVYDRVLAIRARQR